MLDEIPLAGGNATIGVVRIGDNVHKPADAHSTAVLEYMRRVRERGVDVPEPRGFDQQGRMVTEFVPGELAMNLPAQDVTDLARIGRLIRMIHDASEGLTGTGLGAPLIPAPAATLVCHNDLTPWNLVIGDRWTFIDWDGAGLSSREWDLAYSAQAFTLNDVAIPASVAARRLAAFVSGYGADAALRAELANALAPRTWAMHDLLAQAHSDGREPWGAMFVSGHGEHWRAAGEYVSRHEDVWRTALMAGHGRGEHFYES